VGAARIAGMSNEKETSAAAANGGQSSPQSGGSANVKKSHRIRATGASGKQEDKDLEAMFAKFGKVLKIEPHNYQDGILVVSMETVDVANKAVAEVNGAEFQGSKLTLNNDSANQRRENGNNAPSQRRSGPPVQAPQLNNPMQVRDFYPVRILVNSDLIGAIIGKGGETIKEITNRSKARIDVKREVVTKNIPPRKVQNSQIVFISGTPEACSAACKEILTICVNEAKEKTKEDAELNILAEDRFCGRIIGKDGKNLNTIREKTKTSIQLSNSPTITSFDSMGKSFSMDRIITVRGSLDGMCQAEAFIAEKLRQCHQLEMPPPPQYPNYPPIGAGGYGNFAPGWPYVSFPAMDPRRKYKTVKAMS
ncbi:hypothetical protein BOX15_Mlig013926g2, partial [Macrostomum lignano]